MINDSDHTPLAADSRQKEGDFSANSEFGSSSVNHYISDIAENYMEMIENEQWSDLLDHLDNEFLTSTPNSQPNNLFPSLIELSKESTNQNVYGVQNINWQARWDVNNRPVVSDGLTSMMSSGFNNYDSFMNTGNNRYNSASINVFNPQYFGGSSIKNVASPNIFSNGISATKAFDDRTVPPGSLLPSTSCSSAQNFHQQPPFHQGQSFYPSQISLQPNILNNPAATHILPSKCNTQASDWGTYMQPRVQMSGRQQPCQRAHQSDQSNGFKIQRFNSAKPLQGRPLVAEEHSSQSCYSLNCNLCGSATSEVQSRKRKYHFEPFINESCVGSGTLMEVLTGGGRPTELPPLEQWPNNSYAKVNELKGPFELTFEEKTMESSQVGPKVMSGTLKDVVTSCFANRSVRDSVSQESSTLLSQQRPVQLPNLEQCRNNNEDVSSGQKLNQIVKGPEGNIDATHNEMKEPHAFYFEEKTSDEKMEMIQVGPKEFCGFNTSLDNYELVLESTDSTTVGELEAEKTKTEISSFDGGTGSDMNIKLPSASLADSLTASQIKEHLSSFIQDNKDNLESTISSVSQSLCQLCFKDKLLVAPAPIYCSSCELPIKQNVKYYRSLDEENTSTRHSICALCFKGSHGSINIMRGGSIPKVNLQKAKNDEEREDSWVQCDRCSNWQHRICGLYNNETDEEGKAEYVCPKCSLKEIENGTRIPLLKAILAAKDLPRTNLSDHIEQRLFRRMKQEREETAKFHGIELENVLEAEGLVVRVVVSVDKEFEVKQQFRDIFDGQNYPEKFTYRSKLILLLQKRGGVDLCLFGMYTQEFGSECDGPNKRCVYISYLDSVKYFQPERKTASGESLRTFVYHEILIGYLEYCKKRGFATCYIWACPIEEGLDYIFYCHPETQKTPKKDKLRQWYKLMINKAAEDGIVVDHTNLYNQFFVPTKNGNIKISAARLPYFDGDYWSMTAQCISKKLEEKEEESWGGSCSKSPTKRNWMAMRQDNQTKEALIMQKLGESILHSKGNFMIVRLQHMCTYCHEIILSGSRWFCNQCNKIQLCSRCFDAGKLLSKRIIHSCHSGKSTQLSEEVLSDVPLDTKDKDNVLINKFFETREDFLNKCHKSQYQFNTLVHAKYSSMMILYHCTNNLVVEPDNEACHTHNLTHPSIKVTSETKIEQPQLQKVLVLNRALDALIHATQCKNMECCYPDCRSIRKVIQHASKCSIRARNGCRFCKQAWWLLRKHSQMCADSNCRIPRCMSACRAGPKRDNMRGCSGPTSQRGHF